MSVKGSANRPAKVSVVLRNGPRHPIQQPPAGSGSSCKREGKTLPQQKDHNFESTGGS